MASPAPFVPFGRAHIGALATTALLALALVSLARARPAARRPIRWTLAAVITALAVFELSVGAHEGWLSWRSFLPLELCDAAMVLAVATLLAPRRSTAEVVYFWASSGSVLAMLTPELPWSFPRWEFVVFFGLHGLVLVAALVLVFGVGLRPRRGAPWRVFGITVAWAGFVALVDAVLGANFMYLCRKPAVPTLLDWMGPWPVYLGVGAVVALALFHGLGLPFRRDGDAPSV